ncbi:hypothetical protein ACOSQ3_022540 [Xanthoceras sorbifolium]
MTEKLCKILREFKPIIVMVLIQLELAGVNLLYKLALDDGMSMRIMVAYRFIFTTACVLPLALIFERGALSQNLNIVSLRLTSATFVTAMGILVPSLTFVLALIFRTEKLAIRRMAGLLRWWALYGQLLGSLLAVVGGLSYAIWFVLQHCFDVQHSSNAGYALCMEKDFSARKLGWNIRLLTTLYTGALATGLMTSVMAWYMRTKGIIGSVLIICGLYGVIWGKGKEKEDLVIQETIPN